MSTQTPATRALTQAKVAFRVMEYDYVSGQDKIGLHAAEAIGADPGRVLKTLMVEVDGKPACAVIPSDRSLSMKRVAAAFGGKAATMMPPDKAERLTGFHTGGISPFGQKRRVPVAFEASALAEPEVVINGGKRGMMVALAPADALAASGGAPHPLCAD
ncbi:Cys-tRNA(Pro) deacylase [Sinirhodobacter sp. WL0062]|uniref:Cys-tRNA(Pro)/Cys-tRNA(Cys) deacylase n=1 Tax=Rhodobacter flavimaris TaxID=2907145 RepID=A0ABS8YS87_9RHOB|nr:Cys-tRNA(Pro) deacylase [Sinirhodobacter sp. WL0062]MCE5972734.1 Cys-tRNA(Pro) deacylase [Sinirhodobacter sp. WL0062]